MTGVASDRREGGPATVERRLELSAPARLVGPRVARAMLHALLRRLHGGALRVVEGPRETTFGDGHGPVGTIEVRDPAAWSLVLQRGSRGLGESYVDGLVETDDLVAVLRVLTRNVDRVNALGNRLSSLVGPAVDPLSRRRRRARHAVHGDVRAHYDVGDDFFELFLDPTMTYSCACFEVPTASLEEAQVAKLERICTKLDLRRDDHVVEIGSGWGSFAIHAARTRGCRVTTTTVSENQFATTQARVAAAGLDHLVRVLPVDFRDLEGAYSKLVSIEMIEAVDWRDHDEYFGAVARLLAPGGIAVIQAILIGDEDFERTKHRDDFIKRYVFPGGCLPSARAIADSLARSTSLQVADLEDLGAHYVVTLREWRRRLDDQRLEARRRGYGERFLRLWDFYLSYCEAGFTERHVTDAQLVLTERPPVTPPARDAASRSTLQRGPQRAAVDDEEGLA